MSTPVPRHPWRKVTYIESPRPGPHGGLWWLLTLECGHLTARSRGTRPKLAIFRRLKYAPHKVRCIICPKET